MAEKELEAAASGFLDTAFNLEPPAPDRLLITRSAQEGNPHDDDHRQGQHGAILGAPEHAGQCRERH
jgi:hypothetical protein